MESLYERQKIMLSPIRNALLAVGCLVASACSSPSGGSPSDGLPFAGADSMRSGDLVCRLGNGYFSGIFRRFSGESERFSHIGVFHREGDSCFVIHADADELSGVGSVRMESLSEFLRQSHDHQFYRFVSDSIRCGVDSIALDYFRREIPFDNRFDLACDSSLYCTELIAVAINKAAHDESVVAPFSMSGSFQYYRIDDILNCGLLDTLPEEKTPSCR